MKKKMFLVIILLPLFVFAQQTDSVAVKQKNIDNTIRLRDTVFVVHAETTYIPLPESLNTVKHDTIKLHDTLFIPAVTAEDTVVNEFKTIKIIKDVGLFTIIEIILLLFAGALLTKLIDRIKSFVSARNIKKTLPILLAALKVFIWLIILLIIISLFITKTDELIAALFLIGLILLGVSAIPFLRNLVGGFYISLSKPFEKGDYILVKNYSGEITEIGWRSTIVVTAERSFINIPNSVFLIDAVENVNVGQKEQLVSLSYEFPIDYDNDLIIKILRESAISSPYLFGKKEPSVLLENTDYILRVNKYKLNLYLFDSKYENEMIHSINQAILAAVKSKIEMKKDIVNE